MPQTVMEYFDLNCVNSVCLRDLQSNFTRVDGFFDTYCKDKELICAENIVEEEMNKIIVT